WFFSHKVVSGVIIVVLLVGGYFSYQFLFPKTTTRAVISTVQKGTVTSIVSGSGQVTAENEIAVSAKTSGEIVSLNVKAGQEV
ncbi:hypothetical protein, partial [Mycobacterium tuberculosis]